MKIKPNDTQTPLISNIQKLKQQSQSLGNCQQEKKLLQKIKSIFNKYPSP